MKNRELLFWGYINEKRLLYDVKEKKYLYGYKEKYTIKSRKIMILTIFSYPFIKLINDNFVVYGNIAKILIIALSATVVLYMANKWRTIYGNDMLIRYKKQTFEEADLESDYLLNHLIKVKKSGIFSILIAVILIFIYILFVIYYMWSSKFIGILFANCVLPFPWIILMEMKSRSIMKNLNILISIESNKIKQK